MSTHEPVHVDGSFHGESTRPSRHRELCGSLGWSINAENNEVTFWVGRRKRSLTMRGIFAARFMRWITSELEDERRADERRNTTQPSLWLTKHLEAPAPAVDRFCTECFGTGINEFREPCPWCDDGIIRAVPDQT